MSMNSLRAAVLELWISIKKRSREEAMDDMECEREAYGRASGLKVGYPILGYPVEAEEPLDDKEVVSGDVVRR